MNRWWHIVIWQFVLLLSSIAIIVGSNLEPSEASEIVDSSIQGYYKLASTMIIMGATVLGLLLTYVGISANINCRISSEGYLSSRFIVYVTSFALILNILLIFWINSPLHETLWDSTSESLDYYYFLVIFFAIAAGLMLAVTTLITSLIRNVFKEAEE